MHLLRYPKLLDQFLPLHCFQWGCKERCSGTTYSFVGQDKWTLLWNKLILSKFGVQRAPQFNNYFLSASLETLSPASELKDFNAPLPFLPEAVPRLCSLTRDLAFRRRYRASLSPAPVPGSVPSLAQSSGWRAFLNLPLSAKCICPVLSHGLDSLPFFL